MKEYYFAIICMAKFTDYIVTYDLYLFFIQIWLNKKNIIKVRIQEMLKILCI